MARNWTFGQKLGAGFGLSVFLTVIVAGVATFGLREVVQSKDRVIQVNAENVIDAEDLQSARQSRAASIQGFLASKKEAYFEQALVARSAFRETLQRLKQRVYTEEGRGLLQRIEGVEAEHFTAVERVLAIRRAEESPDAAARAHEDQVGPLRDLLDGQIRDFVKKERLLLDEGRQAASDTASRIFALTLAITAVAILLSATAATVLARSLARQIGASVSQVQSSSAELQSAANQQATGAREQATAMSEISTTINELLATSKQISEGAQRVAQIADETARASKSGEGTVDKAHESIGGIRKQVELIVGHMLDLGTRSQQIGVVLDIVSELAEQTNILAINATIEAAGAGEAGKRFAVVADEIRKLADRVAGSTKEIRGLIEDVRSSVNTTVMATESGSKAVAAGSRQFSEVASAFKHIAGLVSTTTEASREIELSTKQQTTAVEQVNLAILSVAQATKETEMSSGQVLQAASQLASLSRDLLRLIRPQTTGRPMAQA